MHALVHAPPRMRRRCAAALWLALAAHGVCDRGGQAVPGIRLRGEALQEPRTADLEREVAHLREEVDILRKREVEVCLCLPGTCVCAHCGNTKQDADMRPTRSEAADFRC